MEVPGEVEDLAKHAPLPDNHKYADPHSSTLSVHFVVVVVFILVSFQNV